MQRGGFFSKIVYMSGIAICACGTANADSIAVNFTALPIAKVANALAANASAPGSYSLGGAATVFHNELLIEGSETHYLYNHMANAGSAACVGGASCLTVVGSDPNYRSGSCNGTSDPGCVTVIGHTAYENGPAHTGQVYVPTSSPIDVDDEYHLAARIDNGHLYAGIGGLVRTSSYGGYPRVGGAGFGATVTPNLANRFSGYGSVWYYPHVAANVTGASSPYLGALSGAKFTTAYKVTTYKVGATYSVPQSHLYLAVNFQGDASQASADAPTNTTHNALGASVGLHF